VHPHIRRSIAALELAGGFVGMALASTSVTAPGLNLIQRVFVGLLGVPFAISVYAGRALWSGQPRGYPLSLLVQAAQVPTWSSHSVLYVFYCGAQFGAWFGKAGPAPMWGLGSRFTLNVLDYPRGEALGLNFLAICALTLLTLDWWATRTSAVAPGWRPPAFWCRVKQSAPRSS
jgi:hypothetical protein